MENIDDIIKILGVVSVVIGVIVAYFNRDKVKLDKSFDDYFDNFLLSYVKKYNKDRTIDTINFVEEKYIQGEYYIPSYVFYILKEKHNDDLDKKREVLHKVLIFDYWNNYTSFRNTVSKAFNQMFNSTIFVLFIFYLLLVGILLVFLPLYLLIVIIDMPLNINVFLKSEDFKTLFGLAVILAITYFAQYFIKNKLSNDYTIVTNDIEKIINKKIKEYENNKKKYFIN
ncbi:hypothetical protein BGT96_18060 [Clostridioides difficile]|uniref:hypothetical protein n=1 Tax=Clostridioides TaxID=1870884 RepID=UPI000BB1CF76|nr:hypothetical protein [Clostridioides difficile]MCC0662612.1 hypothetical protein [Clostridioides sp. ZZV15-6597]EGT4532821.1 hypothetical protein [Clostridioides difficile]EGT4708553.1 hypothetical protein [Clostridioides difficile]EGT4837978.1 hypothetical protein [Clostridioides difficile]EGT4913940.1 hypothetical protein [Clostridioides difficile]